MSNKVRDYLREMLSYMNDIQDSIFVFNLRYLSELIENTDMLSVKVVSDEVVDFVLAEDIYIIYSDRDLEKFRLKDIQERIPMISGSHIIPVNINVDDIIGTLYSLYRHRNMKITMFLNNDSDFQFLKEYPFLDIIKLSKFEG